MEPIVQQTDIGGFSSSSSVELGDKAFFFAQLSTSYPQHLSDFPDLLFFLLDRLRLNNIPPSLTSLRLRLTQSLTLLLNKNVVGIDKEFQISKTSTSTKTTTSLFELLMKLQTLEDRPLKKLAKSHVIVSIKKHQNNHARNKTLQTIIVNMLQSGEEKLANRSLVVFCNLQRINVWCNDLISNAICRSCHHLFPTLRKAALSFLLSHDETMIHNNDTNHDNDNYTDASSNEEDETSAKVVLNRELFYKAHHLGTTASKKKKRAKLKRHIRNMRRQQHRLKTTPNQYSPLSHLHDPDGFVDELYSYLHKDKRRVQLSGVLVVDNHDMEKSSKIIDYRPIENPFSMVNMMIIRVIARTIGLHRLIKPKFYSFIGKYLMPHEKEITKLLAAAVEVFHVNVPDDDVKPLFLQVVNNFVHNCSQPEEIAVGLNVVREISQRMPQLMNDDLLEDLVSYDKHPVKAISIAAHSLLKFFKEVNPSLLSRKFRPCFATNARPKQYGEVSVATGVPGADLLQQHIKNEAEENDSTEV